MPKRKNFDLVKLSDRLREIIKLRLKQRNGSTRSLCLSEGLPYNEVIRYLSGDGVGISSFHILLLAKSLGVKVTLNIEIDDEFK